MSLQHHPIAPFLHNTTSLQTALAQKTLGVGFSGSGFLLLWLTGASAVLRSLGIINADTKLAGASGGAITSAAACQNMPLASEYEINIKTLKLCRSKSNCKGTLESELRSALITPDAIGSADKCKGRLHVAVTAAKKNPETDTGLLLGPNWSDDIQVLNALTTSAYLSHFAGEAAVTDALKDYGIPEAYDGYYTSAIPTPPGVTYAITVSATPPGVVAEVPTSFQGAAKSPFLPLNPVRVASTSKPDIYPGLSGPLKFTPSQWLSFVLKVADDATLEYMYHQGRADAAAFVQRNKLASPAAIQKVLNTLPVKGMKVPPAVMTKPAAVTKAHPTAKVPPTAIEKAVHKTDKQNPSSKPRRMW